MLNIVFPVLQEIVHIYQQTHHSHQVKNSKKHESPVEKEGLSFVDGFNDSAIVTYLNHEIKKELILPLEFLLTKIVNIDKIRYRGKFFISTYLRLK